MNGPRVLPFPSYKTPASFIKEKNQQYVNKVTNLKDYQHFNPFSLSWIIFFSSFVALEELAIPKCMTDLKDKKAQKGGKTFFTMKIRGEPIPEVAW